MAVEGREVPHGFRRLSGKTSILVHVETNSTRCYPESDKEPERNATAEIDENYEGINP